MRGTFLTSCPLPYHAAESMEETHTMTRPVTLFTGQWADLSLVDLAAKAGAFGFDGLELAC